MLDRIVDFAFRLWEAVWNTFCLLFTIMFDIFLLFIVGYIIATIIYNLVLRYRRKVRLAQKELEQIPRRKLALPEDITHREEWT